MKKNVAICGFVAMAMLGAMMAVVIGGFSQATDGVNTAIAERQEASSSLAQAEFPEGEVDETGFAKPLGVSTTTKVDKTVAYMSLTKIQMGMIGAMGIALMAVVLVMWRSSRKQKQKQKQNQN